MLSRPLSPEFHSKNRLALAESIGDEAIAIIDTADVLTRSGDFEYPFHPDANFYYLTGIDEPEAVLVLIPGHADPAMREILFLSGTSDFVADWEGQRLTPDEAHRVSGVAQVFPLPDLEPVLNRVLEKWTTVYVNAAEALDSPMSSPSIRRVKRLQDRAPLHRLKSVLPHLAVQRTTKVPLEVDRIREAIDIFAQAFTQGLRVAKPGVREYEIEAALAQSIVARGATHAFMPIVASGHGATVIHYMRNDAVVKKSDLILMDIGVEVGYYAADISRVIPVSGTFTDRQRAVYQAVRDVQLSAIALHRPGTTVLEIDQHMQAGLTEKLVSLGLITKAQAASKDSQMHLRKYYAHLSHHIGLDVHDVGEPRTVLAPGMVVTCEPGLYLKKEGIGVRLEDDILITEDGCEVLSSAVPSSPEAIEHAMKESSA